MSTVHYRPLSGLLGHYGWLLGAIGYSTLFLISFVLLLLTKGADSPIRSFLGPFLAPATAFCSWLDLSHNSPFIIYFLVAGIVLNLIIGAVLGFLVQVVVAITNG